MPLYNPPALPASTPSRWFTDLIGGAVYEPGIDAPTRLNVPSTPTSRPASGSLFLSYFTAPPGDIVTNGVSVFVNAAGATLTYGAIGLYSVADNGNLTLLTSIPSETTPYLTNAVIVSRSWTTPQTLVAGTRYALGFLFIGTTTPSLPNLTTRVGTSAIVLLLPPRLVGLVTAQAALPATVLAATPAATTQYFLGWLT